MSSSTNSNLATVATESPVIRIWKTIKLGTGIKDGQSFCDELKKSRFLDDCWAIDMIVQPTFIISPFEIEIHLVNLSVADLGFKEDTRYDAICARAKELGLDLCPAEVGPQLRLQYPDQPRHEWLMIAMETICDSCGNPGVFNVLDSGDGPKLESYCTLPDSYRDTKRRFIFQLP